MLVYQRVDLFFERKGKINIHTMFEEKIDEQLEIHVIRECHSFSGFGMFFVDLTFTRYTWLPQIGMIKVLNKLIRHGSEIGIIYPKNNLKSFKYLLAHPTL